MIKHHIWCSEAATIIEGSCRQCEDLERQYPPQGSLDYTDMLNEYFLITDEPPTDS